MIAWLAGGLIGARLLADVLLERLNQRQLDRVAGEVPEAFRGIVDEATYRRTVEYTRARSRLSRIESVWSAAVLCVVLFSGLLPAIWDFHATRLGAGAWSVAGFLFAAMTVVSFADLPLDWYAQFRLEERFGFNTTTQKLWWIDRLKGLLVGAVLVIPLVWLLLRTVAWAGAVWWLYGGLLVIGFQLVMAFVAPIWLLPLFNKFTPLAEGPLRERLLSLARRTRFQARAIEVMDGSKRSRHSNAFFTGLGRFRKIVLFDTLIEQLTEAEVEAVLAHEIGHFRLRHVPKMLVVGAVQVVAGFWVLAWLAGKPAFYEAFGLPQEPVGLAFLLFALLAGAVLFWLSPVFNRWSRKHEYEADAFAVRAVEGDAPLIGALRKLSTRNLSNLTPHPLYSAFHYSHPTLLERETAMAGVAQGGA